MEADGQDRRLTAGQVLFLNNFKEVFKKQLNWIHMITCTSSKNTIYVSTVDEEIENNSLKIQNYIDSYCTGDLSQGMKDYGIQAGTA